MLDLNASGLPVQDAGDLFIVDNSDTEWNVLKYLWEWSELALRVDVATGYFEIGSLLNLEGQWQKLEQIRLLMGDEMTKRTRDALIQGVADKLDVSLEGEKEKNDFLHGVPAIVDALQHGRITARAYSKAKFHAKAYITHPKYKVVDQAALVGSSNFTYPGMTQNVELNLRITGHGDENRKKLQLLQTWFEHYWEQAQDITPDILRVIERHTREYCPFEVYAKALQTFFRGYEMSAEGWEEGDPAKGGSRIYPVLDQYQRDGYRALMKIASKHRGAFLCDGVGLGKTFVGLMLIERYAVLERKKVVLFVPKAAREAVWDVVLRDYLPNLRGDFSNFVIYNHTDLGRGGEVGEKVAQLAASADVVIVDEAHHFRNTGVKGEGNRRPSRYRLLYDLIASKTVFLMTATPVNNSLLDLLHMIELFTREQRNYFKASLGISDLPFYFREKERELDRRMASASAPASGDPAPSIQTNMVEAEQVLQDDALFRALVVQRSRAYVKASQVLHGGRQAQFPTREDPQPANYSLKKTYGKLLAMLEKAFAKDRPLFSLAIYYPLAYYKGSDQNVDALEENRQKAVVGLIRTLFLKRFESSATAFERSCQNLLLKLLAWVTKHSLTNSEVRRLTRWKDQHAELVGYVQQTRLPLDVDEADDDLADIITPELLGDVKELPRDDYKIDEILAETYLDLDQIADFLEELKQFKAAHDDKLQALIKLLRNDLNGQKVLIFSEFSDTARYLERELKAAKIDGVDEVDSGSGRSRADIIRQFAPYYNGSSSAKLAESGLTETRVLIATDVLAEGLNLQDAARLINYDLHWNPVRLMQRIGRIDRRMNPEVEARLVTDHPEQKAVRGTAIYWNFLPPAELDGILHLYAKVSHKTLKISKTFGIEGRKLLTPEDDFDALREFNENFNGATSRIETLHLEYERFLRDHPDLVARMGSLPGRVFSGKAHPQAGCRAVFFCYALPAPETSGAVTAETQWTEEAGHAAWLLYDLDTEQIIDDPAAVADFIRCEPSTPRRHTIDEARLTAIRTQIDKHLKDTYLKKAQAPLGVKPILKAWMELS